MEDGHYIPSSDPILPQNDIEACEALRAAYVVSRSDSMKWRPHDELRDLTYSINVNTYKDLPKNAAWLREAEFQRQRKMAIINVLITKFLSPFRKFDPLNDHQYVEKERNAFHNFEKNLLEEKSMVYQLLQIIIGDSCLVASFGWISEYGNISKPRP